MISILNVTRYATQVNRQHVNILVDTMEKTPGHHNIVQYHALLIQQLSYQQIILHTRSILGNLWDSQYYMREVALHTMEYIDATTTGILLPHILPIEDQREMLKHIEQTLPSTMHLPIS